MAEMGIYIRPMATSAAWVLMIVEIVNGEDINIKIHLHKAFFRLLCRHAELFTSRIKHESSPGTFQTQIETVIKEGSVI